MVVGRANSEELNVVESDEEEITMLPPFYESHVKHSEFTQAIVNKNNARRNNHAENETACDTDSIASSTNGHCPDDKSEDNCDNNTKLEDADKEVIYT